MSIKHANHGIKLPSSFGIAAAFWPVQQKQCPTSSSFEQIALWPIYTKEIMHVNLLPE